MKRILLSLICVLGMALGAMAQSGHPINSAYITPNPVDSRAELMFEEPVTETIHVVVKDLTGKTMLDFHPDTPGMECRRIELDLDFLKRGIYVLQIMGSSGKTKTLRFQKS
jgi:hypothetical protein